MKNSSKDREGKKCTCRNTKSPIATIRFWNANCPIHTHSKVTRTKSSQHDKLKSKELDEILYISMSPKYDEPPKSSEPKKDTQKLKQNISEQNIRTLLYDFAYAVDSDHGEMTLVKGIKTYAKKLLALVEEEKQISEARGIAHGVEIEEGYQKDIKIFGQPKIKECGYDEGTICLKCATTVKTTTHLTTPSETINKSASKSGKLINKQEKADLANKGRAKEHFLTSIEEKGGQK